MSDSTFASPDIDTSRLDEEDEILDEGFEDEDTNHGPEGDGDPEEESAPADRPGPKTGGQPAPRGLNRGAIRRVAVKAQEVSETDAKITGLAAHLLGCGTGLADLTTNIMAADRSVTAPINDLSSIAGADPMEAGVLAAEMGRDRIKAIWSLLAALGAGSSAPMPAANVKAAIAVAKAVFALDADAKADLESVRALLRKN